MSKDKLTVPEAKNLLKAVSKELLKVVSRESLCRKSNTSLKRSKDNLRMSRDLLRSKSKGKLSKENLMSPGNQITALTEQPTKKDMQNYLISHVLFDGKEDVQTQDTRQEEEDMEDRMFEAYKKEMEKYLDFIGEDSKDYKKKKTKKKKSTQVETDTTAEKKLLVNIGSIKNQFESMASPEVQETVPEPIKPVKVKKIDADALFMEQEKEK